MTTDSVADPQSTRRTVVGRLVERRAWVIAAVAAASWLDWLWWPFEVLSHARVHLAVALLLAAAVVLWSRRRRSGLALLACALVVVSPAHPLILSAPGAATAVAGTDRGDASLRVLLINVRTENERFAEVRALVAELSPDVIVFEELNRTWERELATVFASYPNTVGVPRSDNFGIRLVSRLPLVDAEVVSCGGFDLPSVVATVTVGGRHVRVVGTHPIAPVGAAECADRDAQLVRIAAIARESDVPLVVAGDLNCTPWSRAFARFEDESGLVDTGRRRGWAPTWPALLGPLGIPLDHVLVSADLVVRGREVTRAFGSDHRGVLVEVGLPR